MRIEKKIWPKYFEKLLSGEKNFEIRLADYDYKVGDVLVLKEYDPVKKGYSGRQMEKTITYISSIKNSAFWPKEEIEEKGLLVLGLK